MRVSNIGHVLFSLISLFFLSCGKDDGPIDNASDFNTYLQDEMDAQNIPALSVLIFKEGQILHESYLGKANLEQDMALEDDHLFLLASISKVTTATALLQLYDQKLFELNDPINDYLPFKVSVPGYNQEITFKMLLTHTSGIADGSALDGQYFYDEDPKVELDYFLENYLVKGGEFYNEDENFHDFEPGTTHEYSNEGSALIAVLVEQIAEMGFNDYCKQNIFEPLAMSNTSWRLDEISNTIVQPYTYSGGEHEAHKHYTFTDYPNGGLRSTSRDMFKLLSTFVLKGKSNNHQLLSESTINAMVTPQIPAIDDEVGLHMFVMDKENNLWGHDGGEEGVATIMAFNKETKVGAIVLCNEGEANLDEILAEAYELGLSL